ncbi:MAG: hypothetical protein WBN70_19100 [Polyangiales bacterium]
MAQPVSDLGFAAIASLALLSSCADEGPPPKVLAEGGWGGPARLANCDAAKMCDLDHWASQLEFKVIVQNEDAEVSSTDSNVLEVVSIEPTTEITSPIFCFWDCSPTTLKYLSVILHTNGPGDAELVIDGPAGDQRRLPVRVVDVERFQVVDALSGDILEAIDRDTFFVRLEAYDLEDERLAVHGRWSTEPPGTPLLSVQLFDEQLETLEYAATAFFGAPRLATTTLQISIGETLLEAPMEVWRRPAEGVGSQGSAHP